MNELITNSLKHAFIQKGGIISIEEYHENDEVTLIVQDSGPGFDFENYQGKTFGLELIEILVSQVNGTLDYSNKNGSRYLIRFPYQ